MTISKQAGTFVETEIDDEVVLMDLATGNFFSLAGTSLDVWRLVDGTRSADEIAASLAEDYGTPVDVVGPDVAAFLEELRAAGLIEG